MSNIKSKATVSTDTKKTTKKKYKCPYCDMRFERSKLHIHIQNKHEDMIPEGYTALRVAFNTINHKTEGHCIICKGVTDWDEQKGRYNRLCNNPACKEAYKKMCAERNKRVYGTERLQTDPRYADAVQRRALEGRKNAGKYTFQDGGVIGYFGSYEKKFLEFMDTVMNCKSEDILSPGPTIKYIMDGIEHIYLPDFFYEPYDLLIEIKDGGSNPNNHPHRTGPDQARLEAKEEAVKNSGEYNYVRIVNNDFGQLLEIMSIIKYNYTHKQYSGKVFRIHENKMLNESIQNSTSSNDYTLGQIKSKVRSIYNKTQMDAKNSVTGNQNCLLCTLAVECYFRGIDILPRAVYSPRDPIFTKNGCADIVKGGKSINPKSRNDIKNIISNSESGSRFYIHVQWNGGSGGHEFMIINHNGRPILIDAQSNIVTDMDSNDIKEYTTDIIFSKSSITQIDDKELNKDTLKLNDIKYQVKFDEDVDVPYMRDHGMITESVLFNEKDIYYNKDKFDSGEINLCFITGHCGSGKSTMGREMQKSNVEHYELDDLIFTPEHFSMNDLKKYGDLIYSFFSGPGKRFYKTNQELIDSKTPETEHEDIIFKEFVHYAMKYAKSHSNTKFVIEGIWLVHNDSKENPMFDPSEFKDYAFYIKGTSTVISKIRAAKRDSKDAENKFERIKAFSKMAFTHWKFFMINESNINKFRNYFSNLEKKQIVNESILFNEKDIYYNKDKFDSGEVNLCCITGHPGSGKSTMGRDMTKDSSIEKYELDDLQYIADKYSMSELKKYGDLIYSYFTGPGKKFYKTRKEIDEWGPMMSEYEDIMFPGFIRYAIQYAKSHKDKKFVLEGVWFYVKDENGNLWFSPEEFKDCAFYIKGTSFIISAIRASKRDVDKNNGKFNYIKNVIRNTIRMSKYALIEEKTLNKFRDYFSNLEKKQTVNESSINNTNNMYHLSENNLNGKTINPSIPNNYFTKNGYENNTTQRVCFAPSIDKCLRGMSKNLTGLELCVHIPDPSKKYSTYKPTSKEVPDCKITGETWITEPVKMKYIGKIKITGDRGEKGMSFKYGNNTAELYDWNWEWVDKNISEANMLEDMSGTIGAALAPTPIPHECDKDNYYVVQHPQNNVFAYGITKDPVQNTIYSVDPEEPGFYKAYKTDKSKIDKRYLTFKIKDRKAGKKLYDELAMIESVRGRFYSDKNDKFDALTYVYRALTEGSEILDPDQMLFDTRFELVRNIKDDTKLACEKIYKYLKCEPIDMLEEQVNDLESNSNNGIGIVIESTCYHQTNGIPVINTNNWTYKLQRAKEAENQGLVIMVSDTEEFLSSGDKNIEDLKKKYQKYQDLPEEKRTLSNQTASNIFGVDNEVLYARMLSNFLTQKDTNVYRPLDMFNITSDNSKASSYYNPNEISDSTVSIKTEDFIEEWNKEIPINEEAISKLWVKYAASIPEIKEIDATNGINEAIDTISDIKYTSEELKDKIIPIFVILSHGVKIHSKGIQWFTDSEWSHASLSFDSSLDKMYTFTNGLDSDQNSHSSGFGIENKERYKKFDPHLKIKVFALFVTPEDKKKMQDAVDWYIIHQDETKYSFKTIFNLFMRKITRRKNGDDKYKMICSQFVYTILSIVDFKMRKSKDSTLISPADINELSDDARFYAVFQDTIDKYVPRQIDKLCYNLLPTLPLEAYGINESTGDTLMRPKSAITHQYDKIDRVFKEAELLLNEE